MLPLFLAPDSVPTPSLFECLPRKLLLCCPWLPCSLLLQATSLWLTTLC